jgi:hypothetical protein
MASSFFTIYKESSVALSSRVCRVRGAKRVFFILTLMQSFNKGFAKGSLKKAKFSAKNTKKHTQYLENLCLLESCGKKQRYLSILLPLYNKNAIKIWKRKKTKPIFL